MKMKRERKIHPDVPNDFITGYRYIFFSKWFQKQSHYCAALEFGFIYFCKHGAWCGHLLTS